MISWANFLSQLFNGLALGALLALISSGLTIIYGTLGVLNLAHGAMFMLGGYAGYAAYEATGSFIVAVITGTLFVAVVGVVMERVIIRRFYHRPPRRPTAGHLRSGDLLRGDRPLFLFEPEQDRSTTVHILGHHLARRHVLSNISTRRRGYRRDRTARTIPRTV